MESRHYAEAHRRQLYRIYGSCRDKGGLENSIYLAMGECILRAQAEVVDKIARKGRTRSGTKTILKLEGNQKMKFTEMDQYVSMIVEFFTAGSYKVLGI